MRRGRALPAALLVLASTAAWALTGTVVDESGAPVEGADVCYFVGGRDAYCRTTDRDGRFELIDSRLDTLRIEADGFLPDVRPAVQQDAPLILRRAAELLVRLTGAADGRPLAEGDVFLVFPDGKQEGPFPANPAGVLIRTLDPEKVRIVASAEGYLPRTVTVELEGGRREERVIALDRPSPGTSSEK